MTDEKGQVTFTAEDLIAGYTYDYTIKQIAENGDGYLYDLEAKTLSVFVNAEGVASVTGDRAFKNIYSNSYISITTDGGVKPLIDLAGDNTATSVIVGEGTVSYDADTGIVTLNNATAKKLDFTKLGKDFTLKIEGENNLGDSSIEKVISVDSVNMTVDGTGKLTVIAKRAAINVQDGSYTQNGAVIDADAVNGTYSLAVTNDIVFNGGTFDGYSSSYYGIRSVEGGISITNATVTSVATANNIQASGGDITINSGTVNALVISSGTGNCVLRSAGNINLLGGTITATSDERVVSAGGKLIVSPDAKLNLENLNTSISSSNRYVYSSLEDTGVVYVEGKTFAEKGLKVETLVGDEAIAQASQLTERINQALDGMIVSNGLTVEDVKAALTGIPASLSVSLTDHQKATFEQAGSFHLSVTLGELIDISRTLVIDQLPTVSGVDYAFATDEAGMAEGTISVTFSKDFAEGKYDLGLYWGTEEGPLSGYETLCLNHKRVVDGAVVSYSLGERTAIPLGVTRLWVVIDGENAGSYEIPVDRRSNFGTEKYIFGILSDTHFGYATAPEAFTNAFKQFESLGAKFVAISGDFTSHSSQTEYDTFKETYDGKFTIPLFTTLGNHDALDWVISQGLTTVTAVQNMMNNVSTYANVNYVGPNGEFKVTVNDAYLEQGVIYDYTVQYGEDLFVFLGIGANELELGINNTTSDKYGGTAYLTDSQMTWLDGVLENSDEYQNVILMFHYPVKESGITLYKQTEVYNGLYDILKDHPNVIHFSGHTHYSFYTSGAGVILSQTLNYSRPDVDSAYTETNGVLGYTAVHIPSNYDKQTGYVATIYDNGTLLTGYNFATGEIIPHATFFVANEEPVKEVDVTLSATVNGGKDTEVQLIQNGEVIETVTSVDGKVTFTTLKLEDGVYTYTVKQNATNGGGWHYDATVYTITVTVADGVATIDGEAVFINTDRVPYAAGEIVDGKYIVTETEKATEMGLIKIGNDYYYAGPNGVLVTNQDYYAWQLNEVCDKAKGWYTFDKDGKMVISGLYNGRYYVNAIPTEVGLFYNEADGKYYCAGPNGKIVKNADYYVWMIDASAKDFAYNWYRFDETGALYQGVADNKYYVDGRPTEIGLFYNEADGKYYCAGPGGKLVAGKEYYVWKIDASAKDAFGYGWYEFDEYGVIVPLKNGIVDNVYYVNGKPTAAGLIKIGDDYYFANAGGKIVAKGEENEYGTSGSYYVWKIDASAEGMKTGWYDFDETGKMILPLNGIHAGKDGDLYYYVDNKPTDAGLIKIGNDYYFANAGGKLVAEGVENEYGTSGSYYVWKIHESATGMKTGWYNFDETGKLIID